MRVETSLAAVYGGLTFHRAAPVGPVVADVAPTPAAVAPATIYTPERLQAARQMAAAISVSTGIDATGLSTRARHAVLAYATVRDGDRRDYLHRVFGLEERA